MDEINSRIWLAAYLDATSRNQRFEEAREVADEALRAFRTLDIDGGSARRPR